MSPKIRKIICCSFLFLAIFAAQGGFLYATVGEDDGYGAGSDSLVAQTYVPLAPLPSPTGLDVGEGLEKYLKTLFWLAIVAAGVLAVLMLTIGGLRYMASEAFESKSAAKNQITMALVGFLLAISSVLILQTINPDLLTFKLAITLPAFTLPEETSLIAGPIPGCTTLAREPVDQCAWLGLSSSGTGDVSGCFGAVYAVNPAEARNWVPGTNSHCVDPKPSTGSFYCCLYIAPADGCSGQGQSSGLKECTWSIQANATGNDCSTERGMPAGFREGSDTDCSNPLPADSTVLGVNIRNCCVK